MQDQTFSVRFLKSSRTFFQKLRTFSTIFSKNEQHKPQTEAGQSAGFCFLVQGIGERAETEPLQNKYKRFQTIAQERKIKM